MAQEKRDAHAAEEKTDERSIHHRREGAAEDEAQTTTRGEPLSGADHEGQDAPAPASAPRK